jgi:hypothetical protein
MNYTAKSADIFLCDSDRFAARMVKFLMQAPTIWQWIYRAIRHTQQPVRFYHAGMILSDQILIEQQSKVQYGETQKILNRKVVIYRKKDLTQEQEDLIVMRAVAQLGQGYGIAEVIGHTLTWLTGIRWFVVILGALTRNEDICVNRVCRWYNHVCSFGLTDWYESTTKTVDEYCQSHPEEWEVVYQNGVS